MLSNLWEAIGMAEKRTKADKRQRQADKLEKKARHPHPQGTKKTPREDFSEAATRIVKQAPKAETAW